MPGIIVHFGLPLLVTILLMFALRPVARGIGLIDRPGGRKMHVGDVPVVGGLAMMGGLVVGSLYIYDAIDGFAFLLTALAVLVFIGALDDRYDLPPSVRFLAQICAALLMVAGGDVFVRDIGAAFFGGPVELGWFSTPFTVLIMLTAINAFNMLDGSDGVAGVQALIALLFLACACALAGAPGYLPFVAVLAGCIVGFLIFNWPANRTQNMRAFMGDAGSTMLGFSLAWLSIEVSQAPTRVVAPVAILWVFALPIFDLFSSMIRRVLQGYSPFHGDSEHLHHVLLRYGCSSRRVAQTVLVASTAFAAVGIGGYFAGIAEGWLFLTWLGVGVVYHIIFGSQRLIARMEMARADDGLLTGTYWTLWRQLRRAAFLAKRARIDREDPRRAA